MSEPEVVLATVRDRRRVLDTVAAAFRRDPAFRFFFPDDATYSGLVGRFAGVLFDRRLGTGTAWVIEGGNAVALWDPPVGWTADRPHATRDVPASAELPSDVQARIDAWDTIVHALLPVEPHWYLGVLAVDPTRAGRGLGRAVMAAGLARARDDGLPACLETATQANVALYIRGGWAVVSTAEVGGIRTWVMRHPGGSTV